MSRETPESDNDATCAELMNDEGFQSSIKNIGNSRPVSMVSEAATSSSGNDSRRWVDIVSGLLNQFLKFVYFINCSHLYWQTVPLMMAYVTRYIYGTDKLRSNAFEVRGLNGASTGIINCDDLAILSQWLKLITDNIFGLTHLQV